MLPCGHIFCASCLNQGWSTQKGTGRVECFTCRQTFRPDPQFAPCGVVLKAADGFAKAFRLLNWLVGHATMCAWHLLVVQVAGHGRSLAVFALLHVHDDWLLFCTGS